MLIDSCIVNHPRPGYKNLRQFTCNIYPWFQNDMGN